MSVTGPSNLISATGQTRAAILLADGSNSLVLQAQNTVNLDQARVRTNLGLLSTDTTLVLDTASIDPFVDAYATDQLGFRRAALPITNQTVAGTYNLVFTVDGLTRNVSIVINNPTPKIFVLSGTHASGTISTPVTEASGNNYSYRTSGTGSERLKFVDAQTDMLTIGNQVYSAGDKFAAAVDGVFTIEYPSTTTNYLLYANIAISDLALGAYDYKIVKTYPDGRIETVQDRAQVTGIDDNGLALFSNTETIAGTDNDKFNANWIINETNATFVLQGVGTYKYEFTIGSASKTFTINVVKRPNLIVDGIKIATSSLVLYDGEYVRAPGALTGAQAISIAFTKQNLTDANFFTVEVASNIGADFVRPASLPLSLKDLSSISLGTITGTRVANDKIYVTLKFWTRSDYSVLSTRFTQVGETENLIIGFHGGMVTTAPLIASVTPSSPTAVGATITIINGATASSYFLLVLPAETTAPTVDEVVNASGTNGLLYFKGTAAIAASGTAAVTVSGLQANRDYKSYVVLRSDITFNLSIMEQDTFSSTLATGFTSLAVAASGGVISGDAATLSGTVKYYLVATDPDITSTNITTGMTETQLEAATGLMDAAVEDFAKRALTSADNSKFLVAVEYVNGIVARIGKVATGTITP